MRTSIAQLTPQEITELLEICQAAGAFKLDDIQTAEDMKADTDDHGELVSYHPKYGMALVAADPGANQKEHLRFRVWTETSYETQEADLYPYQIQIGEIIDYMGMPVDNLRVVKWFLDHGFKVWPQSIEDAALAAKASGPELQAASETLRAAISKSPALRRHLDYLADVGQRALEEEDLQGFPIGRAMAAAGAIRRGEEPNPEDLAAMDAWRDARQEEIERLKQWVNDLQSKLFINCVYCGHRYGPGESGAVPAEALAEHIKACPKHPLFKALTTLNTVGIHAYNAYSGSDDVTQALEGIIMLVKELGVPVESDAYGNAWSDEDRT